MADIHPFVKFDEYKPGGIGPKGIWVLVIITDVTTHVCKDYNVKIHTMKDDDFLTPDLSLTWSEFSESFSGAKSIARQIICEQLLPALNRYGIHQLSDLKGLKLMERKIGGPMA